MTVRAIMGVNHLPQNDPNWIGYATHGLTRGGNMSTANVSTIKDGWVCTRNAASGQEYHQIPLDRYMSAPSSKITVGVRIRLTAWANAGSLVAQMSGSVVLQLLTDGMIPLPAPPGTVLFFEFSYNQSGVVERRLNGVPMSNLSTNSGQRNLVLQLWNKASTTNMLDFKDLYVVDDIVVNEGDPVGFLGPVVITPTALSLVEAVDYTTFPPGGDVGTAVYSPGSIPTDLVAVSPSTRNPLKLMLSSAVPEGVEVYGLELGAGLRSDAASPTTLSNKLTVDGADISGANLIAPITLYSFDKSAGFMSRAPGGVKWTSELINGAVFTLQPEA